MGKDDRGDLREVPPGVRGPEVSPVTPHVLLSPAAAPSTTAASILAFGDMQHDNLPGGVRPGERGWADRREVPPGVRGAGETSGKGPEPVRSDRTAVGPFPEVSPVTLPRHPHPPR